MNKNSSWKSPVKRWLLMVLGAAFTLVCVRPMHAQTGSGKTTADSAPSPSGTGVTGAAIGSVNIDRMLIGGQLSDVMQLGSAERNEPGIKFVTGTIRAAPGFPGGSLHWLQTCRPDRWMEDNGGHWTHFTSDGPRLDQGAPSKCDDSGGAVASPAVILGDGYKVQTVYDEYTTTLMYQADVANSIPVPLLSFWWYWTGVSTRTGTQWSLTKAGTSGDPRVNMHPGLPAWTGVMDGGTGSNPGVTGTAPVSSPSPGSTPGYQVIAYRPHDPAMVRVDVSLSKQQVYVMEGDRCLMAAACCVGLPQLPTPKGRFKITEKVQDKRSGAFGFQVSNGVVMPCSASTCHGSYIGYPMPFWCGFAPGYGFHQGYVWPVARTHGTIRLDKQAAPRFFALMQTGTPVDIADTQPEDVTVGRNVRRPDDYLDPDPPAAFMTSSGPFEKPPGNLLIDQ